MRPARFTEEETKARILDAANALIDQYGFRKTTIADIADACGFSTANVHKFFGTKAVIKREIARRKLSQALDIGYHAIDEADGAEDKMRAMVSSLHEVTLVRFQKKINAFEGLATAAEEKWDVVREYRLKLLAMVENIIRQGQESGEFRQGDPKHMALGIHMALFRLLHPTMVMEAIGEPDEGSVDTLLDLILAGVRA